MKARVKQEDDFREVNCYFWKLNDCRANHKDLKGEMLKMLIDPEEYYRQKIKRVQKKAGKVMHRIVTGDTSELTRVKLRQQAIKINELYAEKETVESIFMSIFGVN